MYGTYACSSQGLSQEGRLKQQIQFQTTFLSTSHHSNQTKATHRHTHVGSTAGKTIIRSGGDTTLKGAQLIGKGVQADTRNLHIESVQDSETYQGKQQNAGAQVTVGYGFSASGSYSQSKIRADHASVNEQSGIYAGEDGYQINVGNHTDLKGGIITSTQSAEDKGKNRFSTGTLTTSDIKNHSRYEGKSFGLGASATISGKTLGQGEQNKPQDSHLTSVADKNGTSSSVGYGSDRDNQSSVTKSSINTQNIRITDEAKQIQLTGKTAEETQAQIHTDTTTETAQELSGSLKNVFDKDRVQSELDLQRAVIQDFSQTSQQAGTEINRKAKEHNDKAEQLAQAAAKADAEGNKELAQALAAQADDARKKAASWQRGGVLLNMISAGLSAPTQSTAGIMAATASPALSYEIGQQFKKHNAEGTPAHILAHAVLGAAVAAAGDNNALAGALSAGGAEAAAPYISKWLYGKDKGSDLTAEEKETVTVITNLLGTATGAVIGGTTANAAQGSLNAQSAVENNELAFNINSEKNAVSRFNQKVQTELGNKFELQKTGEKNKQGYEIVELVPLAKPNSTNKYQISDLTTDELRFYNMLSGVIQDRRGSANITLVLNDEKTAGGSWITGNFDVGDMEKLDNHSIVLSGNVLIAHEFNEQLDKTKLGLQPNQGSNDMDFQQSHRKAILKHEPQVLPAYINFVEDNGMVNGIKYDKLYYDNNLHRLIGITFGKLKYDSNDNLIHEFQPKQTIIKPDSKGKYIIQNPNNPNQSYPYP